ncbi:cyclic dof factor 1-like [Punica granatum]|uniref:Dof-type domain-containing protein n=2 Tax=Punica granatum TaxID=22663 RepID=A0A218WTG1_PUNGR|nr:cyclic dof factor 1-like [Punica granatum]OWM75933.1 hypothetical protein CDL15_Pgr009578 [Punica granatum]PKI36816.1 hypothetical protein CRG98_042765 [Punica granatum]
MLAVLKNKEPATAAIKLFGKTIKLPSNAVPDDRGSTPARDCVLDSDERPEGELIEGDKPSEWETAENQLEVGASDLKDPTPTMPGKNSENETDESRTDQKLLKKPDEKIPCPRCDSSNTKFCYYNNYNTNQPRHFCRGCQRYWTAGGTMRNVPVGSGRRKSKCSSSSRCCPSIMFDASQIPDCRNYGTILSFSSGFPVPNLVKRAEGCLENGIQSRGVNNGDDCSSVSSSVTTLSSSEKRMGSKGIMDQKSNQGFQSQVPSFPVSHLRFPVSFYRGESDWGCAKLTLGKHSRDGKTTNSSLSSMCTSSEETGFKDRNNPKKGSAENLSSMNSKDPFRGFQPNAAGVAYTPKMSLVLQTNPAALSRSLDFQESS